MKSSFENDRLAQLLIGGDLVSGLDEASERLERAAVCISSGDACKTAWGQAAILTIAECAVRMFRGGVYLANEFDVPVVVGNRAPVPLYRLLLKAGCRTGAVPSNALTLYVGSEICSDAFTQCWADGWLATISPPHDQELNFAEGNEISGALAGAMAVSEAFRKAVLNDLRAGKRTQSLSPLTPDNPTPHGPDLKNLPSQCWLLGLGNLGQAVLWILGLLPYADPSQVNLLLQDTDFSEFENLDIQILTKPAWIGRRKARMAAEWAETKGFSTIVNERSFTDVTRRTKDEPGLAFVGVDNLPARRAAARVDAGFDLLIDAGLGASAPEIFDVRVHCFPGARSSDQAWPEQMPEGERQLNKALSRLVDEGRLGRCGAVTIAGRSVGVPSTAIVAAAMQVAQACRAIASNTYCDLIDVSIADTKRVSVHEASLQRGGVIPFVPARKK